ncbi:MAG TPA: nitroreductase family protein [Anaerolineales bacterium]|nr:nitroreductase family protein [Anaerolineales bacterium]
MTSTTDLHNFLRTRRSVRRFKPDPIPDSVINDILTTATFAPSAHNRQPWRFVVVKDIFTKTRLADAMAVEFKHDLEQDGLSPEKIQAQIKRSKERMTSAPVIIVINLDMSEMDVYADKKRKQAEFRMAMQSVANAGMQLLLAAHAEGLGGVWICSPLFVQETVQKVLDLSKSWEPQGMFYLGYSDSTPKDKSMKDMKDIVLFYDS